VKPAEFALIGIAAIWGLTFTMVQDAVEELPVMDFLGYRFTAAALLVALLFRRSLKALPRAGWRAGLLMGVFLTASYVLQTFGLQHTTASNTGFITGLFVVITPVLAAIFLRQRIGPIGWTAAVVSAFGLYLLSGTGTHGFNARGDGLVLLCAVAVAAHILVTSRYSRDHEIGALLAVQLGVCGLSCLAAGALTEGGLEAPSGGDVWLALFVTAVFASALGFFVQTYAQKHAPPERTALILASEPAFGGLFGYLLAGDRLGLTAWLGAALIMAAIVAVELLPRLRRPVVLPEG
jgi:drug/metabolite transporter (DMT)-like permease